MADNNTVVLTLKVDDQMSAPIATASNKVEGSLKQTKSAFSDLGNELKTNFTSAIKGAVIGFLGFQAINKTIGFLKDARMEFKESVQMQAQLRTALGYTSTALNQQAKSLSQLLIIDNEEITAVQSRIAAFTKDEEIIKKATVAAFDFAAVTGGDAASAAMLLGKAIGGEMSVLSRYGLKIEETGDRNKDLQLMLEEVNKKFGKQAEAVAKSKDAFDKYGIAIKDIQENLWPKLTFGASVVFRMFEDLGRLAAGTSLKQIKKDTQEYFETLKNPPDVKSIASVIPGGLTEEQKERQKKALAELKKLQDEQAQDSIESYRIVAESQINLMSDGIEKEFAMLDLKYELERIKYENNKIMLSAIDEQYANQAQKIISDESKRMEDENKKTQTKKINSIIAIQNSEAQARQLKISEDMRLARLDKERASMSVNASLGTMASIFAGQKKYIAAYKTFAVAQAIMDTYAAANTALKSAPPPFNFIAAGVSVAAGLANVAKISSQKYATGTASAGGGMSLVGENGPEYINLPRGAQVYNNTQTRNMTTNAALNVTITDASGNITETVRAQLRSGQGDQLVRDIQSRMARMI